MTPLMHAVKTNDQALVKLILDEPEVDVNALDYDGLSVVHHLLSVDDPDASQVTYDNKTMFKTIQKAGADIDEDKIATLKRMAEMAGAKNILAILPAGGLNNWIK